MSGYTDHVRSGGTETWRAWRAAHPGAPDERTGAVHLEVVRRLPRVPDLSGLADRVLSTPVPGRGAVDVPLPTATTSYGARGVAPEDVAPTDLIRLAAAVLAGMSPADVAPEDVPAAPPRRSWRPRPAVSVHGSPESAQVVRTALAGAGVRLGGRRARQVVVVLPLHAMVLEHWSRQVAHGRAVRWQRVWAHAAGADRLPGATDVRATLARLEDPEVVVARDPAEAVAGVLGLVGRRGHVVDLRPGVAATEARRWVNRVRPDVDPRLPRGHDHVLGVPRAQEAWSRRTTSDVVAALAGYPVHGDPEVLTHEPAGARRAPDVAAALDLVLAAIGETWKAGI